MIKARKIARAMFSALGNEGFNVLMNNKKAAGQLVNHTHVHIIPRFAGDGISFNWKPKKYKDKEIDELVYKLYGLTKEEIRIVEESLR